MRGSRWEAPRSLSLHCAEAEARVGQERQRICRKSEDLFFVVAQICRRNVPSLGVESVCDGTVESMPDTAAVTSSAVQSRLPIEVLVDGSGRLGALSYLVPDGLDPMPGDDVSVPFGKAERHGLVLGTATHPEKATRCILGVGGTRVTEEDLTLAVSLAQWYFSDLAAVAARLSPSTGHGSEPLDVGPVELTKKAGTRRLPDAPRRRRFLLLGPLANQSEVAAAEAARIAGRADEGQVLVLCPTVECVDEVMACFKSGAARLDTKAPAGAWRGFVEGTVAVGVGTRSAALYSAKHLLGIVVVDESHPAHREVRSPYTNARDIAIRRADHLDCLLSLLGDNPTSQGLGAKVKLQVVGNRSSWPTMALFPRGESGVNLVAPGPLMALVAKAARRGERPTVVLNSKSATSRVCVRCGTKRVCETCDAEGCRHAATTDCACGERKVKRVGWDRARVSEFFGDHVDTTTLSDLSGVHDAGLVILFDIDSLLRSPGLAPETIATSTLLRAARAAGRGGTVAAVSSMVEHPLLQAVFVERSGELVARRTWDLAKEHRAAPFGHTVHLWVGRDAKPRVNGWPGRVFGPRQVKDEWEIAVHVGADDLQKLAPHVNKIRSRGKVRLRID